MTLDDPHLQHSESLLAHQQPEAHPAGRIQSLTPPSTHSRLSGGVLTAAAAAAAQLQTGRRFARKDVIFSKCISLFTPLTQKKNLIITVIRMQTPRRPFPACQRRGVGTGSQTMAAAQYYAAGFLCAVQH